MRRPWPRRGGGQHEGEQLVVDVRAGDSTNGFCPSEAGARESVDSQLSVGTTMHAHVQPSVDHGHCGGSNQLPNAGDFTGLAELLEVVGLVAQASDEPRGDEQQATNS